MASSIWLIDRESCEMGLPDAFKLATLIPSGLLALVKRIVRARIIAGWPLFVYPDSAFQQIDPAERRLHPFGRACDGIARLDLAQDVGDVGHHGWAVCASGNFGAFRIRACSVELVGSAGSHCGQVLSLSNCFNSARE
jgi:hypothetical protein